MNRFSESLLPYTRTIGVNPEDGSYSDWVAGRSILAYGVRIGIRTNRPDLLDRLPEHFPPLWKPIAVSYVERLFSLRIGDTGLKKRKRSFHELFEDTEPGIRFKSLNE